MSSISSFVFCICISVNSSILFLYLFYTSSSNYFASSTSPNSILFFSFNNYIFKSSLSIICKKYSNGGYPYGSNYSSYSLSFISYGFPS